MRILALCYAMLVPTLMAEPTTIKTQCNNEICVIGKADLERLVNSNNEHAKAAKKCKLKEA